MKEAKQLSNKELAQPLTKKKDEKRMESLKRREAKSLNFYCWEKGRSGV